MTRRRRPKTLQSVVYACIRGALLDVVKSHPNYVGAGVKVDRLARSAAKRAVGNLIGAAVRLPDRPGASAPGAGGPRGLKSVRSLVQ